MSAVNLGKQFGPRSGPTNRRAWSGSKLFDILMVFLKEFFQKVNFEKNQQTTKKREKLPSMQWVKPESATENFCGKLHAYYMQSEQYALSGWWIAMLFWYVFVEIYDT